MKILKKINKGLILTILVLVVLIIYFVNLEKQRDKDKPDIKKACEEFIAFTDKYAVLPEELQTLQNEIPEEKVEDYIRQMKKDLTNFMIDNPEAINIQQKNLEYNLKSGYDVLQVRTKLSRKIQKISSYQFENNQVTVMLEDNIEEIVKTSDGNKEYTKSNELSVNEDEIILKKVDGNWKVVYANLQFADNPNYYNGVRENVMY